MMVIIAIAMLRMKSLAVSGIFSVFTARPVDCWKSPLPLRNSPRMRAIANEIAANTAAKPMNMNPVPTCCNWAAVSDNQTPPT